MNEQDPNQFHFDYRTGRPTCINGDSVSESEWRGCVDLNRARASAIISAARQPPSWESVPADVWADTIARETEALKVPLISLEAFGLFRDQIGILGSSDLIRLAEGKEAIAWKDNLHPYVYKLFNLYMVDGRGHLGQKIEFRMEGDFECTASFAPADIFHIVDKLRILHQIGACPTEIVGLTEGGYFLVAKQPFCVDYKDLDDDRREATRLIRAVVPTGSYQQQIAVFWADGKAWTIGDLHRGNIRRMKSGIPTIIDAMIGEIPPNVLSRVSALSRAVARAKQWKETGNCPPLGGLIEGSDDEL